MVENEIDESSATKSGTSEDRGADSATPYSFYASYNLGAMITSVTLTGENYNERYSEMTNAICAKQKLGFIDGSITKPSTNDPSLELWLSVNSMTVGRIRTSIEPRVRSTITFVQDSQTMGKSAQMVLFRKQGARTSPKGTASIMSSGWTISV